MDYLELNCKVKPPIPGNDILVAMLAEIGFESFVDTEEGFLAYIPQKDFSAENLAEIKIDGVQFSYETKVIVDRNWNEAWEKSFEPVMIADQCLIRAPFHAAPEEKIPYEIIIEPKMSFGTGHHDTTSMMVEAMLELDLKNKSVLDVGCGSGVLSILAAKLGARAITGIDNDQWAYLNAIENTEKNKVSNIEILKGEVQVLDGKILNVILANINKNVLLADMEKYATLLHEGYLLLSGFLDTDSNDITECAGKFGFKLDKKLLSGHWVMLQFKK